MAKRELLDNIHPGHNPDKALVVQEPTPKITAVVVTFNRRDLLAGCLEALESQTYQPNHVLVVDNASTDGTLAMLEGRWCQDGGNFELLSLPENLGGAGGFATGIAHALKEDADWIWLMDDDAVPEASALNELMAVAKDPGHIYGSVASNNRSTAWTTTLMEPLRYSTDRLDQIPECARVETLPFLGFLIHRDLVARIGLPDVGFFIAGDDIEYCVRATQVAGANMYIAGKSRIEHPKAQFFVARVLGFDVRCLQLVPWKRYYDTRNRLLIARRHYGHKLLTQTIPGTLVRLMAVLLREPRKLAQTWAVVAGMVDGLIGLTGRRHERWGISQ